MDEIIIDLPDESATAALARRVAPFLRAGDVVALRGDLGAGKTSFARALIRTLLPVADAGNAEVPSPTFTLIQSYDTQVGPVSHFDLYRIDDPEELIELGWDEALSGGIVLVEWPDRAGARLPFRRLDLTFIYGETPGARRAALRPSGGWAEAHPGFAALSGESDGE